MDKEEKFNCDKSYVIKQISGTCWFNAILMTSFYSEGMRKLLIPRIKKWENLDSPKQIIKDLVLKHYVNITPEHIKFFEKFKPEILLKELYKANPEIFNFDPDKGEGYFAGRYFTKLLKYLDITDISVLDAIKTTDGYNKIFYSQNNVKIDTKNPMKNVFGKPSNKDVTEKYLSKTPEVLIIMTKRDSDIQFYPKHYYKTTLRFNSEIIYNNVKYVADSLLLANFNNQQCKKGHEIAGVTCNKRRYMYNGWTSQTVDAGISGKLKQKVPCSLMPHDWLDYTKSGFCIDRKKCDLFYHDDDKIKATQLCFSYTQGPRIFTYIRKDSLENEKEKPKPKIVQSKLKLIVNKPEIKPNVIVEKPVPPKKIVIKKPKQIIDIDKPKTKLISPKKDNKEKDENKKGCPPGKILNPKTGRCVNKTGKIGKEILK